MRQLLLKLAGAAAVTTVWAVGASASSGHGMQDSRQMKSDNQYQAQSNQNDRSEKRSSYQKPADEKTYQESAKQNNDNYHAKKDEGKKYGNDNNYQQPVTYHQPVQKDTDQGNYMQASNGYAQPKTYNRSYQKPDDQNQGYQIKAGENDSYLSSGNQKHDEYQKPQPRQDNYRQADQSNYGRGDARNDDYGKTVSYNSGNRNNAHQTYGGNTYSRTNYSDNSNRDNNRSDYSNNGYNQNRSQGYGQGENQGYGQGYNQGYDNSNRGNQYREVGYRSADCDHQVNTYPVRTLSYRPYREYDGWAPGTGYIRNHQNYRMSSNRNSYAKVHYASSRTYQTRNSCDRSSQQTCYNANNRDQRRCDSSRYSA